MAQVTLPTMTPHQAEVLEAALRQDLDYVWSEEIKAKSQAIHQVREQLKLLGQKKQKLVQIIASFILAGAFLLFFFLFLFASPFPDLPWLPYVLLGLCVIMGAFGGIQFIPYSKYDVRYYALSQQEATLLNELLDCIEKEGL